MQRSVLIITGILLIAAGALIFAYQGIPYRSRDVIVSVGPVKATADVQKTQTVPPVVTGLAIAGGILLVIVGARKR